MYQSVMEFSITLSRWEISPIEIILSNAVQPRIGCAQGVKSLLQPADFAKPVDANAKAA